ncbi:MAG TPA: tRNA (N6-threonylcarbamoyladenosine(37)-N6)-methyltransferase TrmO [Sandaracinaceae bacterium LLY-WYZ-13_1]|nr:tRNA (N6-threonylcarbamoyladenosine(37)-N6)-methyltransferase TrmO [Sandaracinaceae bacterium LLY-WYZ-13_1]
MARVPPPRDYARRVDFPDAVTLRPIGVVRSPHVERHGTPRQATVPADPELRPDERARVELFADAAPEASLRDLDGFDYVWVIAWLHLNEGWRPTVVPPRGPRLARGLFATRAPHRPNPLALSSARILALEPSAVVFERLDLLDGTPVLDLKPYVPAADAHPNARAGWVDAIGDTIPPSNTS